jgi:hypothetical protein
MDARVGVGVSECNEYNTHTPTPSGIVLIEGNNVYYSINSQRNNVVAKI